MKFQKLTALFLSTALTVGLLAGCSSGGSGSSTTQTPAASGSNAGSSAAQSVDYPTKDITVTSPKTPAGRHRRVLARGSSST